MEDFLHFVNSSLFNQVAVYGFAVAFVFLIVVGGIGRMLGRAVGGGVYEIPPAVAVLVIVLSLATLCLTPLFVIAISTHLSSIGL